MNGPQRLRKRGDIPPSDLFAPSFPDPVQNLATSSDSPTQFSSQSTFSSQAPSPYQPPSSFGGDSYRGSFPPPVSGSSLGQNDPSYYPTSYPPQSNDMYAPPMPQNDLPSPSSGYEDMNNVSRSRRPVYQGMGGPVNQVMGGSSSSGDMRDNKYARKSWVPRWLRQLSPTTVIVVVGVLIVLILLGFLGSWLFRRSPSTPVDFVLAPTIERNPLNPSSERYVPPPSIAAHVEEAAPVQDQREALAAARKQAFLEKQRQREMEKERERQQAVLAKQREQEALAAARNNNNNRAQAEAQEVDPAHSQAEALGNQRRLAAESRKQAYLRRQQEAQQGTQQQQQTEQQTPPPDRYDQGAPTGVESPPSSRWHVYDGHYVHNGGELGAPMTNLDDCRRACEQTEECRAITMYKKMGHCTMKSHSRVSTHSDWYSELKDTQESPWVVVPDTYISGGDDATVMAYYTLPECRAACLQFPSCIAITQNENSNECFLKTKVDIFPHENWHTEVLRKHSHLIPK